jgi:hypothetical protein
MKKRDKKIPCPCICSCFWRNKNLIGYEKAGETEA